MHSSILKIHMSSSKEDIIVHFKGITKALETDTEKNNYTEECKLDRCYSIEGGHDCEACKQGYFGNRTYCSKDCMMEDGVITCQLCNENICEDHLNKCGDCKENTCGECLDDCECCNKNVCKECLYKVCGSCVKDKEEPT